MCDWLSILNYFKLREGVAGTFLSHTNETQKICCFLADVEIILVSLFELSNHLKVIKMLKPSSPGVQSSLVRSANLT